MGRNTKYKKTLTLALTRTRTGTHAQAHNTTNGHSSTCAHHVLGSMSHNRDVLEKDYTAPKGEETACWRTPSGVRARIQQRRLRFTLPGLALVGADNAWARARTSHADATAAHQALRMPDHLASKVSCQCRRHIGTKSTA